jgi:hypothetical protein
VLNSGKKVSLLIIPMQKVSDIWGTRKGPLSLRISLWVLSIKPFLGESRSTCHRIKHCNVSGVFHQDVALVKGDICNIDSKISIFYNAEKWNTKLAEDEIYAEGR